MKMGSGYYYSSYIGVVCATGGILGRGGTEMVWKGGGVGGERVAFRNILIARKVKVHCGRN